MSGRVFLGVTFAWVEMQVPLPFPDAGVVLHVDSLESPVPYSAPVDIVKEETDLIPV